MIPQKIKILNDDGMEVDAVAPMIISASRATDIPAFYTIWFFNRLHKGYVKWHNPFNGVDSYVYFFPTRDSLFSGLRIRLRLFRKSISELNERKGWNYKLATCAEKIDLSEFGIDHNRCIDDELKAYLHFYGDIHRQKLLV